MTIDVKLKTYEQLQFEITKLNTDIFLKGKEIERLNNKIKEQNLLLIEFQDMEQKLKLKDNIINELEKYLEEQSTNLNRLSCSGHVYFMYQEDLNILIKLKELKESGNNE